jgi:hypothetical protein
MEGLKLTKIKYADEIAKDKLSFKSKKEKTEKKNPAFRLYNVNKNGQAKGFWENEGKIYKDKLSFVKFNNYVNAKRQAIKLLKDTKEVAISIENTDNNTLYIIYRNKIQILKVKYSYKTLNKRQAIKKAYRLTKENGGSTVYKDKSYYIVISYI